MKRFVGYSICIMGWVLLSSVADVPIFSLKDALLLVGVLLVHVGLAILSAADMKLWPWEANDLLERLLRPAP